MTSPVNLLNILLALAAALVAVLHNRSWLVALTAVYAALLVVETVLATPVVYESVVG